MKRERKNLLTDESTQTLREMLAATERAAGINSAGAKIIRRTLQRRLDTLEIGSRPKRSWRTKGGAR